jgi:hypothetical protein
MYMEVLMGVEEEQYFSYNLVVRFIEGGNWSAHRKPQVTEKLDHIML